MAKKKGRAKKSGLAYYWELSEYERMNSEEIYAMVHKLKDKLKRANAKIKEFKHKLDERESHV